MPHGNKRAAKRQDTVAGRATKRQNTGRKPKLSRGRAKKLTFPRR